MPGPYTVPYAGVNPYVSQIADAIGRQGTIAAQGALARGNAVAQALQGVGQSVVQGIEQHQKDVREAPQRRLQQLQVGQAERQVQSSSALADVLKTVPRVKQGGMSLYDTSAIGEALSQRGYGDAVPEVLQRLTGVNQALQQSAAANRAALGRMAQGILAAGADPTLVGHGIDVMLENGELTPDQAQQYRAFTQADPANGAKLMQMAVTQMLGPQKLETAAPGSTVYDPTTRQPVLRVPDRQTFGQPQVFSTPQGNRTLSQGSDGRLYENGQPYAGPVPTGLAARPSGSPKTLEVLQAEAYARGDMREVARIQGVLSMNKAAERAPQKPEMVFLRQGDQQIAVPVTEANTYLAKGWRKYDPVDSRNEVTREQQNASTERRAGNALDTMGQLVTFTRDAKGNLVEDVSKRHKGFNSVFGVFDAAVPTVRQDTADAETLVDQLVSLVTQPEMQTLRGLGPASDRDVAIIQAGATTLRNRKLSEAAAIKELQRLYVSLSNLRDAATKAGKEVPGLTTPATAPVAPTSGGVGQNPFRK